MFSNSNSNSNSDKHKIDKANEKDLKINKILCFSSLNEENTISVIISMEAFITKNIQGYARIN